MRYFLSIIALSVLSSFYIPPEGNSQLHYRLIHDGKQVGEIAATRTVAGKSTTYNVETSLEVRFVLSQKVRYTSKAVYVDGQLQGSSSRSFLNDKLHHNCVTNWKTNHYEIVRDKEVTRINRQIAYSGVILYFREPGSNSLVYSEMSGYDNKMRRTAEGQYTLTDSKSRKQNRYWYKGGILDHATINHALYDLEVQRIP